MAPIVITAHSLSLVPVLMPAFKYIKKIHCKKDEIHHLDTSNSINFYVSINHPKYWLGE